MPPIEMISVAALAIGTAPLGVMLMLRRLSLMSDALSHAVLPGVALAVAFGAASATALMFGAAVAAVVLAALAASVARVVPVPEDTSFAALYLPAFAVGAMILSAHGQSAEVLHVLFGGEGTTHGHAGHGHEQASPVLLPPIIAAALAVVGLALLYRPLLADGVDKHVLRGRLGWAHVVFTGLVALVLVANFRTFGALMTAGMMVVPAASARLWTERLPHMLFTAVACGLVAGAGGLWGHMRFGVDLGPAVCAAAGMVYLFSLLTGRAGGLLPRLLNKGHLSG